MSAVNSRRKTIFRSVVLAVIAAGMLIARMPASYLATFADAGCDGRCRLVSVIGPWWAGSGVLLANPSTNGNWQNLGPFAWRLLPASGGLAELRLLNGNVALDADIDGIHLKLDRIDLPAASILSLSSLQLPTADWRGTLELSAAAADWRWNGESVARGRALWQAAASSLLEDYPLGTLESNWQWRPTSGFTAQIAGGTRGKIDIRGQLRFEPGGNRQAGLLALAGDIHLESDARDRLEKYVRLLGRPDPALPGRYRVTWPAP